MKIIELEQFMEDTLPRSLSCEWDNDGLMLSFDINREVNSVLLSLDVTEQSVDCAIELGVDAIITHHPFIFKGFKRLTDKDPRTRLAYKLISHNIAVLSYHTRLDAVDGGVNDIICSEIKMTDIHPLGEGELSMSRIGDVENTRIEELAKVLKARFDCPSLLLAKSGSANEEVSRVCVLGGACDRSFIDAALSSCADLFVTGDASYNNILDANIDGMHMICLGHYCSENLILRWFENKLNSFNIKSFKFNCGYFQYL